jgi:hypothetical protein
MGVFVRELANSPGHVQSQPVGCGLWAWRTPRMFRVWSRPLPICLDNLCCTRHCALPEFERAHSLIRQLMCPSLAHWPLLRVAAVARPRGVTRMPLQTSRGNRDPLNGSWLQTCGLPNVPLLACCHWRCVDWVYAFASVVHCKWLLKSATPTVSDPVRSILTGCVKALQKGEALEVGNVI